MPPVVLGHSELLRTAVFHQRLIPREAPNPNAQTSKVLCRAGAKAYWVKVHSAKAWDPSSIPGTHVVMEDRTSNTFSSDSRPAHIK